MRVTIKHLISVTFLLCVMIGSSQAQWDTTWIKTYGGIRDDQANDIIVTADNGFLLVGSTSSFGFDNTQMYFLKLDSIGNIMWSKSHGGDGQEAGNSVIRTSDGGYLAVGYTNSWGEGGFDLFMVKLDSLGNLEYEEVKGGFDWDFAWDVIEPSPGKYVIAGETQSFGNGNSDGWLLQFDESSRTWDWETTVGTSESENLKAVTAGINNDFFATGLGYENSPNDSDIMLVRFTTDGDSTWTQFYGDTLLDYGNDIIKMSDDHYGITGVREIAGNNPGVAVLKVDSLGVIDFDTNWSAFEYQFGEGQKVMEVTNSRFGVAGTVTKSNTNTDMYLAYSFPNNQYYQLGKSLGKSTHETCNSGVYLGDDGYAIAGYTNGFDETFTQVLMYKTNKRCRTYSNDYNTNKDSVNLVGVQDLSNNTSNIVYNTETYELKLISETPHFDFKIFDLTGREFKSGVVSNSSSTYIRSDNYPSGIYLLVANNSESTEHIKMLIYIQ